MMGDRQIQSFGELISSLRALTGKTQEELAVDASLSVRSISDLERDKISRPRRRSLELLAAALNLEPAHAQALITAARKTAIRETSPNGRDAGWEIELNGLYQRVLTNDRGIAAHRPVVGLPEAVAMIPRQLPGTAVHFAGRSAELAALDSLLGGAYREPPGTLVIAAIAGTAGVGKTALALQWAHRVADCFPDGQLYMNLRGFDPSGTSVTPQEALRSFIDAMGMPVEAIPADLITQAGLYRSLLAGRRVLIVLDNARDQQQIRPLLPGGPGCLVVVTSRNQLVGLAAAEGAHLLTLDVPPRAEALQMLGARLGEERLAAQPDAADRIVGLCGRLPLALAIASARAAANGGLSLTALADELGHTADRLDILDTADPATSVRAVFSWSVRQLSHAAGRMFRLLGLHPGPDFDVTAAASLTATAPVAARMALRELTTASLLTEHSAGRYALHDLLRVYAAEQTPGAGDEDGRAAAGRMLDHYLCNATAAALLISPSRQPITRAPARAGVWPGQPSSHQQAMAWFETEYQVLLAATALAARIGSDVHAWQLPWAMADFLDRNGHWHDSAAIQSVALAAATRLGDMPAQAMASRALGKAYAWLKDYDRARAHLADSLGLYQQLRDRGGQARVRQSLNWVAERQARYAEALGHAEQALTLFQATADQAGQAAALNAVGWCHVKLGDADQARLFCRQALAMNKEYGNRRSEALTWDSLGYAEHELGNFTAAAAHYQRALSLFREFGDRFFQAEVLTHLGDTRHANGHPRQAQLTWREALDILEDLHHPDAHQLRRKLRHR